MPVINNNSSSDLLKQQISLSQYMNSRPYCWPQENQINPKLKKNINNNKPIQNSNFIIRINKGENNFFFKPRSN